MTTLIDLLAPARSLREKIRAKRARAFQPPPRLSADQWADTYRIVPTETSAISGPWRTSQVEIARGPMRAVSDPAVRRVSCMASAQIFKTTVLETAVGYYMQLDPCPILFYSASQNTIDATISDKIDPMIINTPELAALWGGPQALEAKNERFTRYKKRFPGGALELLTINSTANLRNRAAKVVLIDEVDDCTAVADGDPLDLAAARAISFKGEEKIVGVSTPTIRGESKIEAAYQASDMRKPYIACPTCGHEEYLKWSQIHFKNEAGETDASCARYIGECGHEWTEADRVRALTTEGAISWRQTKPFRCCGELQHPEQERNWSGDGLAFCKHCGELPVPVTHAGFWGWIAYHPRWSLRDIVQEFLDRKGDRLKLQEFVNNRLAETWGRGEEEGLEQVDPDSLEARAEPAWDLVPAGVKLITLGVDVQPRGKKQGLYAEVVGWGDGEETWSLDYHHIEGDPDDGEVWAILDEIRTAKYVTDDGRTLTPQAACVDTGGHNMDAVMSYCGARRSQRVWAIKGASEKTGSRAPIWPLSPPKTRKRGAALYILGTQAAKDWLSSCLSKTSPGPQYVHVPAGRSPTWFSQILNERRFTVHTSGGRPTTTWKPRAAGVDTEALDCRVYAKAALEGLKRMGLRGVDAPSATAAPATTAEKGEEVTGAPDPASAAPPAPPTNHRRRRKTGSGFWS